MEKDNLQIRVYKYPLKPTISQASEIDRLLDCCRLFYNSVKEFDINHRSIFGRFASPKEIESQIKDVKNEILEYDSIHSHLLQTTLKRYIRARQKAFKDYKANKAKGFHLPRWKSRDRFNTLDFKEYGNGCKLLENNKIKFNHLKIPYRNLERLEGEVKYLSITKENGKYYVLIHTEAEHYTIIKKKNTLNNFKDIKVKPKIKDKIVGIDIGIAEYLTLSDGGLFHNPKLINQYQDKIIKAQRILSRRTKGSSRYNKQKKILSKNHSKLKNVRNDLIHKITKDLVNNYDILILEDLKTQELMDDNYSIINKHLANIAPSKLVQYLSYKAENAGKEVLLVDPRGTSQECSNCGKIVKKELSDREHICPHCGIILDRDYNSSLVIKNRGLRARNGPSFQYEKPLPSFARWG
jgi:putative transposase